ncbi:MAG: hypothetical protein DHS20C16_05350 [Phycisphaerae bacterium]|nr:MAG: hypothetical protein DHS20C16_05350 [Phycisphaerae bacterium]
MQPESNIQAEPLFDEPSEIESYKQERWPPAESLIFAIVGFCTIGILTGLLVVSLVLYAIDLIWVRMLMQVPPANKFLGMGAILILAIVAYLVARRIYIRSRWTIVIHVAPKCYHCRYDLTGNESGICPECGTTIPAAHPTRSFELE